jgi:tetratricopeptide (TPR) repeat protein
MAGIIAAHLDSTAPACPSHPAERLRFVTVVTTCRLVGWAPRPPHRQRGITRMSIMSALSPTQSESIASWYQAADEARKAGRLDGAQSLVDRILSLDPMRPGALYLRGLLALDANQLEAAQNWIERAIHVVPHADFFGTLCIVQIRRRAFEQTTQTARRGLALHPESTVLRFHEAVTLQMLGRVDEAAVSYHRLLELDPEHALAHANMGVVAKDLEALDEAERHLRRAIALAPGYAGARASLATVLLAAGRYEEAWPYFEDRWANFVDADGRSDPARPHIPLPQWKRAHPGTTTHANGVAAHRSRLLVIPEQGHGDSLQFARYLPLALDHFSQVTFVCPPSLRRLFEESFGARWPGINIIDDGISSFSQWDYYCPLMSLPMAFGTTPGTIPNATPYLYADANRAQSWRARLAQLAQPELPRVGVVWAGGHSGLTEDFKRSLSYAQFAPLLAIRGLRWISLQKTDDPAKRADASSHALLTDWTDELSDFADTAALIENLDLVISVDTSVAHLAAAMGKPVWLLNRYAGCWRWLRDRDDSPWYPSLRLFTQRQRGDWSQVLADVAVALQQRGKVATTESQRHPAPF